jgi:hypothetical protein
MGRMRHRPPTGPSGQPPTIDHVDWSDDSGTIRFSGGTCTVSATPDTLTVRIDADDEDALQRLQDGVTRRLETVGRRDHLKVRWQPSNSVPGLPSDAVIPPSDKTLAPRSRRLGRALSLVALGALAVLLHIGLLGGALAASPWANWGADIVLAIVLLKVVTVGAHVVLGRLAFRHRGILRHRVFRHR